MWGKWRAMRTARITTLIGEQAEVRGDLVFDGGLHIEGRVRGNVVAGEDATALVTLAEQGVIEGEVRAPNMVINGTVDGDIHATGRLELAPRARVNGDVHYRLLEMAIGAEVNGRLVRIGDSDDDADQVTDGGYS